MVKNITSPTEMAALYFVYNGATSLEKPGWRGLSHLMEHLFAKNFDALENALQANGIDWNAFTSENQIVFYFTGLEKYLAPFREDLIARTCYFGATPADVRKEKKIVLEEYMDCFTDQGESHQLNFWRQRYGSYTAIGLKEDIQGITHADCVAFYELQYAAPDMIINVSPSFVLDQQELLDEGYRFVDRLPLLRTQWAPEPDAPQERVADVERDKTSLLYERFVAPEDAPVMMFLNEMMGAGLNSPLYSEVREKRGLVYSLDCCLIPLGASFVQHLYTVTSNENVAEVDAVVRMVLGKRDEFITAERLDMVRKSLQIRAEKNAINRFKFVDDLLTPENAAFAALVDTVSLVELHAAFDRYFYLDDYVRSADHEG